MIEINLLPGARKKARKGGGGGVDFKSIAADVAARIKDPYLVGVIALYVVAIGGVAFGYTSQGARDKDLNARRDKAVTDSTAYAKVIAEQLTAKAQADSVRRQFQIIRLIDGNRYIWAHLLDEISRAVPDYTWIGGIHQQGLFAPLPPKAAADADPKKAAAADTVVALPPLKFRLVGNTVDIQAMTRFMRLLEASPFIRGVTLLSSRLVGDPGGKEYTEFELEADYEQPPPSVLRTTSLSVKVK